MSKSRPDVHDAAEAKRAKADQARRLARSVADMDTQQRLEEYAVELDQAAAELERQPAAPQLNPKTFDERATLARAIAERVDVPSLAATWLVIARQYEYLALFPHSP